MNKWNLLMKEVINNEKIEAMGISQTSLKELGLFMEWHKIRKIFRDRYYWFAITSKDDLIQIAIDKPKDDYKYVDYYLYKDLRIITVLKEKRTIAVVNGRIDDIKALNLPYKIDEYEVKIDITDDKKVQKEINDLLLNRVYEIEMHKIKMTFKILKKFDLKIHGYGLYMYLYGKYHCSFNGTDEILITGQNDNRNISINEYKIKEPKEENIEYKIKKFLISQ